ncbi:molybdenum cofactor biosynthesis protein B [Simiduia agarivorans]|uniref:Molybdenum cofactor biosynthesis protein B n=1 Tax=Simiduia agarivorans (strain DSM 21679 / JCM 13881 / BCRC 17597 / SA1) TaxID=1117647 RepID=K4L1Y7_SIMAS|nr:molybdenum cofactor biosynthesis protein B [Simiduia agarivorans]AFV00158.1 molybdenum cofactor biosynthesis protein B [Simiduia agarivorans SA1 = DSM 21679]
MGHQTADTLEPLNIAVLTVSDTRNFDNDTSGLLLIDKLTTAGHQLADRALVIDDVYQIRAQTSAWIARADVQVILITGGTGFTARDSTPEAMLPLFDKTVEGFGELFRQISYAQIGTSTIQSRALAGLANGTLIFCLPGSNNACRTAWDEIIGAQLDARQGPCNFVPHLQHTKRTPCSSRN